MKMTRSKLKGIVKECLVEILSEGIGSSGEVESSRPDLGERKRKANLSYKKEQQRLESHRKKLDSKITETVAGLTDGAWSALPSSRCPKSRQPRKPLGDGLNR